MEAHCTLQEIDSYACVKGSIVHDPKACWKRELAGRQYDRLRCNRHLNEMKVEVPEVMYHYMGGELTATSTRMVLALPQDLCD